MGAGPKITLRLTPLDNRLDWCSKLGIVIIWAVGIFAWATLPDTIPTHFSASGQADGQGPKWTLLILPILGTIFYIGLTQLNKYPHIFNYTSEITLENAHDKYLTATRMFRLLKLTVLLVFSMLILFIYLAATGVTTGLGGWFLPVAIGLFVLPTIITIWQAMKK